jgi:hypothetical protein
MEGLIVMLILAVGAFLILVRISAKFSVPSDSTIPWKNIESKAKYYFATPNGMWRLAVIADRQELVVKNDRRREKIYKFSDLRSVNESNDGGTLILIMRDVDFPEWRLSIGRKNVGRWREIIRQEIID